MSHRKPSPAASLEPSPCAAPLTHAELARISTMPPGDILAELALLRLLASSLLASAGQTPYVDQKLRLLLAMRAIAQASDLVLKRQASTLQEDPHQDLWDSLQEARRLERLRRVH